MPIPDCFLRSVLLNPEDDTPRKVLADYLEETAGSIECEECAGRGVIRVSRGEPSQGSDEWSCHACKDSPYGPGRVSDGKAERAEFIKTGIEIAAFNPPPIIHTANLVSGDRGTAYLDYHSTVLPAGVKVGKRIDVDLSTSRVSGEFVPDWRVTTIENRVDLNTWRARVYLHKMGPWKNREVYDRLRVRQHGLCAERWEDWCYDPKPRPRSNSAALAPASRDQFPRVKSFGWAGHQTFRKGFVGEVSSTMDDFVRHAGELFLTCPIEKVNLTNKRPAADNGSLPVMTSNRCYFRSLDITVSSIDHNIHPEIFDLMPGGVVNPNTKHLKFYNATKQAGEALLRGCVLFGRVKAGLITKEEAVEQGRLIAVG